MAPPRLNFHTSKSTGNMKKSGSGSKNVGTSIAALFQNGNKARSGSLGSLMPTNKTHSAEQKKPSASIDLTGGVQHGFKGKDPTADKHIPRSQTGPLQAGHTRCPALPSLPQRSSQNPTHGQPAGPVSRLPSHTKAQPSLHKPESFTFPVPCAASGGHTAQHMPSTATPARFPGMQRHQSTSAVQTAPPSVCNSSAQQSNTNLHRPSTSPSPSLSERPQQSPLSVVAAANQAIPRHTPTAQSSAHLNDSQFRGAANRASHGPSQNTTPPAPRPPRVPLSATNAAMHPKTSSAQAVVPPAFAPPAGPIQLAPASMQPSGRIGRLSRRPRSIPGASGTECSQDVSTAENGAPLGGPEPHASSGHDTLPTPQLLTGNTRSEQQQPIGAYPMHKTAPADAQPASGSRQHIPAASPVSGLAPRGTIRLPSLGAHVKQRIHAGPSNTSSTAVTPQPGASGQQPANCTTCAVLDSTAGVTTALNSSDTHVQSELPQVAANTVHAQREPCATPPVAPATSDTEERLLSLGFTPCAASTLAVSAEPQHQCSAISVAAADARHMGMPPGAAGPHMCSSARRSFSKAARCFLDMPAEERQFFIEHSTRRAGTSDAAPTARRHSAPPARRDGAASAVAAASLRQPRVGAISVTTAALTTNAAPDIACSRDQFSAPGVSLEQNQSSYFSSGLAIPAVVPEAGGAPPTPLTLITHAQIADPSEYGGDDWKAEECGAEQAWAGDAHGGAWEGTNVQENGGDWGNSQGWNDADQGNGAGWGAEWDNGDADCNWQNTMHEDGAWGCPEAEQPHMGLGQPVQSSGAGYSYQCETRHPVANLQQPAARSAPADDLDAELRMAEEFDDACEDDHGGYEDGWDQDTDYIGDAAAGHSMQHAPHLQPSQPYPAPGCNAGGAQMAPTQPYPAPGYNAGSTQMPPTQPYPAPGCNGGNAASNLHEGQQMQPHMKSAVPGAFPGAVGGMYEPNAMHGAPEAQVQYAAPPAAAQLSASTSHVHLQQPNRQQQQQRMHQNVHQHTNQVPSENPCPHSDPYIQPSYAHNVAQSSSYQSAGPAAPPQAASVNAFSALRQGQLNLQHTQQPRAGKSSSGQNAAPRAAQQNNTARATGQGDRGQGQGQALMPGASNRPTAVLHMHDARSKLPPMYAQIGPPASGLGQTGQQWWTVLQDFVPYALLKGGTDPRNDNCVYVRYETQFAEIPASKAGTSDKPASKQGTSAAAAVKLNNLATAAALGIGNNAAKTAVAGKGSKAAKSAGQASKAAVGTGSVDRATAATKKGGKGSTAAGAASKKTGKTRKRKNQDLLDLDLDLDGAAVQVPRKKSRTELCSSFEESDGAPAAGVQESRAGTSKNALQGRGAAMLEKAQAQKKPRKRLFGASG